MSFLDDLIKEQHKAFNLYTPDERIYYKDAHQDSIQRTVEWFISRRGRVTGSVCKELMACTQGLSKKYQWGDDEKVYDFGEGFKKTVYRMSMELKYNSSFLSVDAANFRYGRIVEPYIISKLPVNIAHKEVSSIDIIKGVLSASPDGELTGKASGKKLAFEAKAGMTIDTIFGRMESNYDVKHIDFWQTQTEMLAVKCKEMLYGVALPAHDIKEVMKLKEHDDNIDLLSEMIPDVLFKKIKLSEPHINALLARAAIAGNARDEYLKNNCKVSIDECISRVI